MKSKSKSKNKSVERTKEDKSKMVEPPEIIQIKQPLSKGNQNANSNKNTQVVQIVFPEDTEIRKIKKKKKGKSSATKKKEQEREELLNQLKQKLDEYDALQEQAQKLKIKIPEEMGIKVINQSDLKSNDDISNYINDVVRKIAQLQELLQQSQQTSSAGGMTGMSSLGTFNRLGAGVIQFPTLPASRPFTPSPVVPPVVPPSSEGGLDPRKKAELDRLAREAQERISGGGGSFAPFTPSQPSGVQPIEEGQLVETKGVRFRDQRIDVKAPKGFVELYERYRRYLENIMFITRRNEIIDGVYHIHLEQENDLFNERDRLVKDYLAWFNSLDRNLNAYLLNPSNKLEFEMNRELKQDSRLRPQDTAKRLFEDQKIPFTEITGGNEIPAISQRIQQGGENPFKKESDNKAYQKYTNAIALKTNNLIDIRQELQQIEASGSAPSDQKISEINGKINKLQTETDDLYNSSPPNVRLGVIIAHDKLNKRYNDMRELLARVQNPPSSPTTPPTPLKPSQIDPVINSDNAAIENLNRYIRKPQPNYTKTIQASILQLFGDDFYKQVNDLSATEKRSAIMNKFAEYMRKRDPNWSPPNPADRERQDAQQAQRRMVEPPALTPSPPPSTLPSQPLAQPTMGADGVMRFSDVGSAGSSTI